MTGTKVGIIAAVLSALAFSTEGLFSVRSIEQGVDVSTALVGRYLVATAVVVAYVIVSQARQGQGRPVQPAAGRDLMYLAAAGLLAHFGLSRFLFEAFLLIPTWLTLLVFYTYPVMVALGEHFLGRDRLTGRRFVTVLVTLTGVALVAQTGEQGAIHPLGIVYALGAAGLNTVFMLVLGPMLNRVALAPAVAAQFAGGLLGHLLVLLAGGAVGARLAAAAQAWVWLVALGLVTTVISVAALNIGVRAIGAGRVSIISTLEPLFVIIWGVTLLGETITGRQLLGAALIVIGVLGVVMLRPGGQAQEQG